MDTVAIVLERPEQLALSQFELLPPGADEVVVDVEWSGISTGTERLLWSGEMPHFPGMGYPLIPGYETVGRVSATGSNCGSHVGDRVFVPGARCFGNVRALFGGAASRLVVPDAKVVPVDEDLGERAVLLALAATACHAMSAAGRHRPSLIVGHGVLGRLLARFCMLGGGAPPVVWERDPTRRDGADGYDVIDPADDDRHDYETIYDVSGDPTLLDTLISRLAGGGEVVLAGFYAAPMTFAFPPAFMREARLRVSAEWKPNDMARVTRLVEEGGLSLDGLITHRADAEQADKAYRTAFGDPACLKMILDWRARP